MHSLQRKLRLVAHSNVPVLITGESGTGKEILARIIHQQSPWTNGPFVKVNCPAIPGTLLESELFGYERGAFTGAHRAKPGRVEMSHLGSLFLDEIGEMELGVQSKLLQLLQDGQFCRIGGREDMSVEIRVICATHHDLEHEVSAGRFRQDLFYRINVVQIRVPSLRERAQDIPALTNYFLETYTQKFAVTRVPLRTSTVEMMQRYSWPGNIRQLENMIKRYVILGSEDAIIPDLVPRGDSVDLDIPVDGKISLKKITRDASKDLERRIIVKMLHAHNWNRKKAAAALSISYRALLYKIREAGVDGATLRPIETAMSEADG